MLSRRHFIGAGAGAAGLFGLFGRLRFRPQRRKLLGLSIMGENALLVISRSGETPFLLVLHVGEAVVDLKQVPVEPGDHCLVWFNPESFQNDIHAFVAIRPDDDGFAVELAHVTTHERKFSSKPSMIRYSCDQPLARDFSGIVPDDQHVMPMYA